MGFYWSYMLLLEPSFLYALDQHTCLKNLSSFCNAPDGTGLKNDAIVHISSTICMVCEQPVVDGRFVAAVTNKK